MPAFVTVAYPRPSGAATKDVNFNLKYYLETHMPLVSKLWGSQGLKSWTVTEHADGPYVVQAVLKWDSLEEFGSAAGTDGGKQIFADVANFTDLKPELFQGDVKGSWQAEEGKL